MKEDNITYQAVLGWGRREGKKEKRKSNLNLTKSLDMRYLTEEPLTTWGYQALEMWPEMCQHKGDTDPGFQVLSKPKQVKYLISILH